MKKKSPVYITGHRHPDTDSIASSIAYAFFKKSMGIPAIPCRLGSLNSETEYRDEFSLTEKIQSIQWMDDNTDVAFTQEGNQITVRTVPFVYGRDLVVRVAKIMCE